MALALMGASDEVFIVSAAFGMWNGKFNHANLPWCRCLCGTGSLRQRSSIIVIMHWNAPSRFQLRL